MTTSTENQGTATVKDVSSQPVETATALPNSPQTVNVSSENQGAVSSARKCADSPEQCVTPRNQTGNPSTTEQCSVSVAKELPFCAWPGCQSRVVGGKKRGGSIAEHTFCYPHAGEVARKTPEAVRMFSGLLATAEVAEVRPCSVPGCNCVLGVDVKGDLCAPHRRQAERKCARKGCSREHLPGSIWCRGHHAAAASVSCDNLPAQPTGGVCEPRREEGCACCHIGQPCSCCSLHRHQQGVYLHTRKLEASEVGEDELCMCGHSVGAHNAEMTAACNARGCPCAYVRLPERPSVPEEHEQPNDGYQTNYFAAISKVLVPRSRLTVINDLRRSVAREVARGFVAEYEQAWQLASDDEHNEPVTVAQCKLMSDAELTRLLSLLSEVLR